MDYKLTTNSTEACFRTSKWGNDTLMAVRTAAKFAIDSGATKIEIVEIASAIIPLAELLA